MMKTTWYGRVVMTAGVLGLMAASYGVITFILDTGLPLPVALFGTGLLEGGVLAATADLYHKSRARGPVAKPRATAWVLATFSAWANLIHAPTGTAAGALVFAAFPLLGTWMIEYEVTNTKTRAGGRSGGIGPARVAAAAWRRGWTAAATGLGLDVHASDSDTERELAARRAARATYRLRLAQKTREKRSGLLTDRRVQARTRAAQRARERAAVATDQSQAVRLAMLMRELVHGPEHATEDWHDIAASASRVYGAPVVPIREHPPAHAPVATRDHPEREHGAQGVVSTREQPPAHGDVTTPRAPHVQTGREQDEHTPVSTPREHSAQGAVSMAVFNPLEQGPAATREQGEHTAATVAAAHREHPRASHRELAEQLGLSKSTVRRHRPVDHVNGSP